MCSVDSGFDSDSLHKLMETITPAQLFLFVEQIRLSVCAARSLFGEKQMFNTFALFRKITLTRTTWISNQSCCRINKPENHREMFLVLLRDFKEKENEGYVCF